MKNVLLFTGSLDPGCGIQDFNTIVEAQEYATGLPDKEFHIFTLYTVGTVGKIEWNVTTDHATNVRANKVAAKKPHRFSTWTDLEAATLVTNYKTMSIKDIAAALGRSYNAVYSKLVQQGAITPVKRKK